MHNPKKDQEGELDLRITTTPTPSSCQFCRNGILPSLLPYSALEIADGFTPLQRLKAFFLRMNPFTMQIEACGGMDVSHSEQLDAP